MGEIKSEGAISPVGSVSQPEVKKSPLWKRVLRLAPKEIKAPDITPTAVQSTDFAPALEMPAPETSPVNADAPDFSTAPSTPIDAVAHDAQADLTAQMAAHVNSIPGTARPPEVVGFAAPTNPPTETATASSMAAEADTVVPTPIRTETPVEPPTPTALTKEPAA